MSQITAVRAREILDSRGNPTLEAEVYLASGDIGIASVPSGASTGQREALELRDKDPKRFGGKGVLNAVMHVNVSIAETLVGQHFEDISQVDRCLLKLDGTHDKSHLGANAILAVSLATVKAFAKEAKQPLYAYLGQTSAALLPVPMMNIINGGAHANNHLDIQEFMILPQGATHFREALRWGSEIFHALKSILAAQGLSTAVGDEGGFAPTLNGHEAALDNILQAIEKAGYRPGTEVTLGLDVASSEFYKDGRYHLQGEGLVLTAPELCDYYQHFCDNYPIISIEDGMAENDWDGWYVLTERFGNHLQLVGDDLFVTNPSILKQGIAANVANALLVKPNQIGTLSETLEACTMAQHAGYGTVLSHRSGETEDTTIADLAVAINAGQIKTGSLCRTDRIAKYNRLLKIEEELGNQAVYAGHSVFSKKH